MKRAILAGAIMGALAGCAPLKPTDCEKANALANCKYIPAAAAPAAALDSTATDCNGKTNEVRPLYPVREQALAHSGRVNVSFDVKPNGRATNYRQTGDAAFFREAWRAVSHSCWKPGEKKSLVLTWKTDGSEAPAGKLTDTGQ